MIGRRENGKRYNDWRLFIYLFIGEGCMSREKGEQGSTELLINFDFRIYFNYQISKDAYQSSCNSFLILYFILI
jgi:hypothetical protein